MSLDIVARGMAASADTKAQLAVNMIADFPTGLHWKGACAWDELPSNPEQGDAWTITDRNNAEYAWNGSEWQRIDTANVDQTYNPTSPNAQSGTAVSQAVDPILKDITAVIERGAGEKTQEKGEVFNIYPDGYFNPEITNSDLVTFNGSDEYARFQYTKGIANYSAGSSYRFEMDCLIYSGTPMIRVGADETGARIPEQSDYVSYYDKTKGKYIVQFTFNADWNGQNLGIMVGNYETLCRFICANPALYLLDSEGNPVDGNLINTFAPDYYSTSRTGNKWNRRSDGYTCTALSDSLIAEISNNNLKAGYLSHAEGQGTWATARMAHSEGRGNNFECTLASYEDNILTLISKKGSDVTSIRKNAVLFIEQDGFGKFVYATSSASDIGEVTINESIDSFSVPANVKVIMGGSTSSWAHTEGNFTNAVDLNAEDLEDTADSKTRQHAEGSRTLAVGYAAHAEGEYTQALGNQSHAEGEKTVAGGVGSHAEGRRTQALAEGSHTSGLDTIVNDGEVNRGATAIGRFNEPKDGDLFEVGNGTSDNDRHNAFEIKSDGSAVFNGNVQVNGELTGAPIIIKGGDGASTPANKIAISNSDAGQITNEGTATLFGFTSPSDSDLTIGHKNYNLRLRGKENRPRYTNNNKDYKDIALFDDISAMLQTIPGYDPTVAQHLGHSANDIISWVND